MTRRDKSSERWLARQRRDPYVRRAAERGLPSRAHFKLEQLDRRFHLLSSRTRGVLELGAAPGGWTRYIVSRNPRGPIVAVDARPMNVPGGVVFLQLSVDAPELDPAVRRALGEGADLVLSDMSPNISGVEDADQAASESLVGIATECAARFLNPGGHLLVKMFQGAAAQDWARNMQREKCYERVVVAKPEASRSASREVYGVALAKRG